MHYTEDSIIFPYNQQYQSTPSLINTDFDPYQDNNFEFFSPKSSIQIIPLDKTTSTLRQNIKTFIILNLKKENI